MKDLLLGIYNFIFRRSLYVVADARDSSITLSKRLFKHMDIMSKDRADVFVFRIQGDNTFGFMLNPDIKQKTQLCQVQYNDKHKCIGFETLCPTVAKIFYVYGIRQHDARVKLSVKVRRLPDGKVFYKICRPHEKPAWKKQ